MSEILRRDCCASVQSCPTLCDPVDCSPPGSSVQGILLARILEWLASPFSGDLPDPGVEPTSLLHWQADSLPLSQLGRASLPRGAELFKKSRNAQALVHHGS